MPNFIEIGETTMEKIVTKMFYTLQYLAPQGQAPGPKVPCLGGGVQLCCVKLR